MLTEETIKSVKETAPLLAEHGVNITELFYTKLFSNHPELKHIFNMSNQAQGDQAKALAESVFLYAAHIDNLDELRPMVTRIAHKHASLNVLPEHYPIVGKYLLEAIQDYFDLPEDAILLKHWGLAYEALASIFINVEEAIYQDNAIKEGGWRGFKRFLIDQVVDDAEGVKSFHLVPDDSQLVTFEPGQYVGVKIKPANDDYDEIRQYSLSNSPGEEHYRITVKAEQNFEETPGKVSNYLHSAKAGDEVWLQPPTGDFVLKRNGRSKVFIAGGVGMTPVMSMLLETLKNSSGQGVTFIQCCRNEAHHIMKNELYALQDVHGFQYYVAYTMGAGGDYEGALNRDVLNAWLPEGEADIYFCGPKGFMADVNRLCQELGYEKEHLHYEVFGPTTKLEA
jgi:nitric oxide dioxygenase